MESPAGTRFKAGRRPAAEASKYNAGKTSTLLSGDASRANWFYAVDHCAPPSTIFVNEVKK